MASSKRHPLTRTVHVDEFLTGEYEEGKPGRSNDSKKKLSVVILEILKDGGVSRAYAQVVDSSSTKEFRPFFKSYISPDAHVITDVWKGYLPLKKEYPLLEQIPSKKGKNFPTLHIHIMKIQGWVRGIHHHCSKEHFQSYLDEYSLQIQSTEQYGVNLRFDHKKDGSK